MRISDWSSDVCSSDLPHDVQGLIGLLGGRDKFNAKPDEFFTKPYDPTGICRDCTGLIGQYVQGNQPDQQAPYYYNWSGQRSEGRRVGKGCGRTWRSRWMPEQ